MMWLRPALLTAWALASGPLCAGKGSAGGATEGGHERPVHVVTAVAGDRHVAGCPEFEPGVEAGHVTHGAIVEASGIAASWIHPVFWVHNDSGDWARIFALDSTGVHLGSYELEGAMAYDWEDIAVGPGPVEGLSYLYVGDIGDNAHAREHVVVYRVPEPETILDGPTVLDTFERFELRYPGKSLNAEALMIDPRTGDLYLVSKSRDEARVFRAQAPLSSPMELDEVARLAFSGETWITAGDISPDGSELILRSPKSAWLFLRGPDESLDTALMRPACILPLRGEPLGESIGFSSTGYVTLSEGSGQPLWRFDRRLPPPVARHVGRSQSTASMR